MCVGGKNGTFKECVGCIEIMDNVFIGTQTTILFDVRIGSNVIIGANSLVNKDLEGGYVYAGNPVRKICSFDEFVNKRINSEYSFVEASQHISKNETHVAWSDFNRNRTRACLKNHSRNLHAPLCGIFCPNSVAVAHYDALIRTKSPTNCDAHLA